MALTTALERDMISMRQAIARLSSIKLGPTSTPTFNAGTITNNLSVGGNLGVTGTGSITSDLSVGGDLNVTGNFEIDGTLTLSDLTASRLIATNADKELISVVELTDHSILVASGTGDITSIGAATDGQIPIGSTGADPVLAALTGTANQITVTNGAGSITLSTPQDIHTGASPTWVNSSFTGYTDMAEIAEPATPAADNLRLYVEDIQGFSFYKYLDSGGMKREVLRDSMILVYNDSGDTILANRVVYATGNTGNVPTIALAKSNSESTMPAIGVTIEDIANAAYGRVMQVGLLENIDTSALSVGDVLYVHDTVAGLVRITPPTTPALIQEIGTVLVDDASVGTIQVIARGMSGYEYGTIQNSFSIGDGAAGNKVLTFNAVTDASITWDETKFDFGTKPLLTTGSITAANAILNGTVATGLDMSGGTFATANINLAADPIIQANAVNFIRSKPSLENLFIGAGAFGGLPGGITQLQNDGNGNLALGYRAGYNNNNSGGDPDGTENVYIGFAAGYGAVGGSSGYENVGIGSRTFYNLTSGNRNVAIGRIALGSLTTGIYNVAIGSSAGFGLGSGQGNTLIGYKAGFALTGSNNVAIGREAMYSSTSAQLNVAIGNAALENNITGRYNVAIGWGAASGAATYSPEHNTIIGYEAGTAIRTGTYNTFIGKTAGYSLTTGTRNVCIGWASGYAITTQGYNVFIGILAGRYSTDSNRLIIDNQGRGNAAGEVTNSLLYGVFDADPANQYLNVNGSLYLSADNRKIYLGTGNDAEIYYDGTNLVLSPRVVGTGGVSSEGDVYPNTDDTYYVGKNDDDSPLAWKGIILKDQTDGKYYRCELNNGSWTIVDLTD
uniref:Putative tail protein n=1 Tax=viral metagenome TaxID=1070528 RepID=A0A6M3IZK6_9ZZZZ